jgi:6-phosphogluconolactonase (cycloisomerase 2 family)
VCDELDSTVTAYAWDSEHGELKPFQVIPTLPETFIGRNSPAEIQAAPSGRFIYVSNRGHDSIVTFGVDPATGRLAPLDWESTRGRTPRFFTLDPTGGLIYAANLQSHNIVAFGSIRRPASPRRRASWSRPAALPASYSRVLEAGTERNAR